MTINRTVYGVIGFGGTGCLGIRELNHQAALDGNTVKYVSAAIDTEDSNFKGIDIDDEYKLNIGLRPQQIDDIIANPDLFGKITQVVVEKHSERLLTLKNENGSCTTPLLTAVAAEYYSQEIVKLLQKIVEKATSMGAKRLLLIMMSSTGGGAGRALLSCVSQLLADSSKSDSRLREGISHIQIDLVHVVADPFGYTHAIPSSQADNLLANVLGSRYEIAELEKEGTVRWVYRIGKANSNGVVLDTREKVINALGNAVYALLTNWSYLTTQYANSADRMREFNYNGSDTPEAAGLSWEGLSTSTQRQVLIPVQFDLHNPQFIRNHVGMHVEGGHNGNGHPKAK
ncbi:hypothetical protein [Gimesia maris]|uniref:hypothetical protein n=1 Tax=Gimesia maris TaxID=122 RepID=UPI0032EBBA1C